MGTDYGFDIDGFLMRIEPAYGSLGKLPTELQKFGENYLDLCGAGVMLEAFVAKDSIPPLHTNEKENLEKVLEAIGGEDGLQNYTDAWSEAARSASIHPTPYDFTRSVLYAVEKMKQINDPEECMRFMDDSTFGKSMSSRDKAKKN